MQDVKKTFTFTLRILYLGELSAVNSQTANKSEYFLSSSLSNNKQFINKM